MKAFSHTFRVGLLACLVFAVMVMINMMLGHQVHFDRGLLINFGYTVLYTYALYFANAFIFVALDKWFKSDRFSKKRLFVGFLGSFVVTLIVIFLLHFLEAVLVDQQDFNEFLAKERASNYIVSVVITLIVTLSLYSFYFYKAYQDSKVKEQKIIAGTANAQFESLKNQIDPHFLFNSLNVLSSLIEENPDSAQKFTTSLSKIYRYVLEQKDKELVPLSEELSFAKTYMNLLKMRFENSLFYELPIEEIDPEAKVVPLSLQLLLENTVKHNVVSEQKPLHIKIYLDGDYLVVENNYQKKEVLQDRKGVGLDNIASRYGIITQRKVLVNQTQEHFAIRIPILTKQVIGMELSLQQQNTAYYRAKKRVDELKGFYGNLISYCIVIPILIIVNLYFMPQFQWFWFSLFGWGFGLIGHAFKVFGYGGQWEERKIRQIMHQNQQYKTWK
ncbi:histidine kinase [Flavobacterium sp. CYK-55]|uniref:histidine kinase n=1 Tax=Flavobacterium sp. CYK-55 TaxID=2835529 RepID=UPI001BD1AF72|nr:histidine kinase [Flavobacterium sp. CYK-55]MBS7787910.1 histidine kinase [Flavobacterium sp. CYK-55]